MILYFYSPYETSFFLFHFSNIRIPIKRNSQLSHHHNPNQRLANHYTKITQFWHDKNYEDYFSKKFDYTGN